LFGSLGPDDPEFGVDAVQIVGAAPKVQHHRLHVGLSNHIAFDHCHHLRKSQAHQSSDPLPFCLSKTQTGVSCLPSIDRIGLVAPLILDPNGRFVLAHSPVRTDDAAIEVGYCPLRHLAC